jgi:carboxyvinyl-carboxyphosphonate phosphorylmutase
MTFTDRRQRFRAVLAGTQCVHPGSVFDPISARIAEDLGFEIGMFAGSIASFTVLGAPDLVVLSRSGESPVPARCRCWLTPITATATR